MFPLIKEDKPNPMELFQIWLNLPKKSKMVEPHFKMFWHEDLSVYKSKDGNTKVEIIAGSINGHKAPAPPPNSWAADPANHVAVLNIKMDPGSTWTLPKAAPGLNRTLYYYEGEGLQIAGEIIPKYNAVEVEPAVDLALKAGNNETGILVLQGKPINEPVIQYGPFVMNTKEEINQAFEDYHRTKFGGWPWKRYDQVHDRNKGRFAQHADGRIEEKGA